MKQSSVLFALTAFLVAGCASHRHIYCVTNSAEFVLTPTQRTQSGMRLVSVAKSGKVTIDFEGEGLASARPGEIFSLRKNGLSPWGGGLKLILADSASGRVVVESTQNTTLQR
jgi:hypothetical protein